MSAHAWSPFTLPRSRREVGPLEKKLNRTRTLRLVALGLLVRGMVPTASGRLRVIFQAAPINSIKQDILSHLSARERTALAARFWAKVQVSEGKCWQWLAGKSSAGYGVFHVGGRSDPKLMGYAHRVAWELTRGPIPSGLAIDHIEGCRCVNPEHMEPVTVSENSSRGDHRKEAA